MRKLLFACTAGMSTRLLIQRMREEISSRGLDLEMTALSLSEALDAAPDADVVLLGPQIAYARTELERAVHGKVPIGVISMADFGHLNVAHILDQALDLLDGKQEAGK